MNNIIDKIKWYKVKILIKQKLSNLKTMEKILLLVVIPFLLESCNDNHPETFLGIKLGYPADEQFKEAAEKYPMVLTHYGSYSNILDEIILSKDLNVIGYINYNTFKINNEKEDLLESIDIQFQPNADIAFIKNLYFNKYGNINENNKSVDYINDTQESNYQEVINVDNEVIKSYQWHIDNLTVVLDILASGAKARYYYRTNFIEENENANFKKKIKNDF